MAALTSEFGVELPYADSHAERAWTIRTFGFGWRHTGELSSAPPTAPWTVTPAKVAKLEHELGKSAVEIERTLLNRFRDLSRGELKVALEIGLT